MIPSNAALVEEYWEPLLVLPSEPRQVAGREPLSEQRSEGRPEYLGGRYYPSTATGHLLRLPGLWVWLPRLRISRLSVSCLRISRLWTAGVRIPRPFGIPRLFGSPRLWIPRRFRTSRRPRSS